MTKGVLNDDDPSTDLGSLEKKLQEKSRHASLATTSNSPPVSPLQADNSTPQSSLASPGKEPKEPAERRKSGLSAEDRRARDSDDEEQEEVEALSEMMCSLVTNQSGETRYIGTSSRIGSLVQSIN